MLDNCRLCGKEFDDETEVDISDAYDDIAAPLWACPECAKQYIARGRVIWAIENRETGETITGDWDWEPLTDA